VLSRDEEDSNVSVKLRRKLAILGASILFSVALVACQTASQNTGQTQPSGPTIDVSPVQQGEGQWKIAGADTATVAVNAPGAQSVRILYRPLVETDRHVVLKTIKAPTDSKSGKFSAELKLVPDFAGDVWAQVSYPDGTKKETEPIQLARYSAIAQPAQTQPAQTTPNQAASRLGSIGNDESARSDKFTGGKIEHTALQPGQPDIAITVDVPAFRLTLWQNGKEVRTYEIGVGMKKYPIDIGERRASQIIWNPEWVPPDSEWVIEARSDVEPGEHIEAGDPRNPLGKIKIPLGDGYLLHEAHKPTDIGHLVSHGCVRMLQQDLLDLAQNIITARALSITKEQIARAMNSTDRLVAKLDPAVLVDINYDTAVVEGGVLHIYPDVYDRGTNTIANVRAELQSVGVDASQLDDQTLKGMLARANPKEEFMVSVADIKAGRTLVAGTNQPLTSQSVVAKKPAATGRPRHGARGRR
jgi:lipoprotein-anchoring transpeptidase ErfK/SrfK